MGQRRAWRQWMNSRMRTMKKRRWTKLYLSSHWITRRETPIKELRCRDERGWIGDRRHSSHPIPSLRSMLVNWTPFLARHNSPFHSSLSLSPCVCVSLTSWCRTWRWRPTQFGISSNAATWREEGFECNVRGEVNCRLEWRVFLLNGRRLEELRGSATGWMCRPIESNRNGPDREETHLWVGRSSNVLMVRAIGSDRWYCVTQRWVELGESESVS